MNILIDYNFYLSYLELEDFSDKLELRIQKLRHINGDRKNNIPRNYFLSEYFVEIFCWSVIPSQVLLELGNIFQNQGLLQVIDPCCGNAFHGYLLEKYLGLEVFNIDIQEETLGWSPIIEMDGREYLQKMSQKEHLNSILWLSWIDYPELSQELLNLYQGNLVVSVGNYEIKSPDYLKMIREKYHLVKSYVLQMPWNLTEKIEVYTKS